MFVFPTFDSPIGLKSYNHIASQKQLTRPKLWKWDIMVSEPRVKCGDGRAVKLSRTRVEFPAATRKVGEERDPGLGLDMD